MKRYAIGFFQGAPAMFEQPDGDYVKWSDVQALLKPINPPIPTNPQPLDQVPHAHSRPSLAEIERGAYGVQGTRPFTGALNDVPATLTHDEGAYAQCGECGRYTLNPNALTDRPPPCDCGSKHGWSGSFKRPGPDAKWSGLIQPAARGVRGTLNDQGEKA